MLLSINLSISKLNEDVNKRKVAHDFVHRVQCTSSCHGNDLLSQNLNFQQKLIKISLKWILQFAFSYYSLKYTKECIIVDPPTPPSSSSEDSSGKDQDRVHASSISYQSNAVNFSYLCWFKSK